MKTTFKLIVLIYTSLSFGQTIEEEYREALYFTHYNNTLQSFFDKIVAIKPVKSKGDYDKILYYTLQPISDVIVTQITYRLVGTLPDDDLDKYGSIERVKIVDLIGTHQFKPRKYSIFLDHYDEKLEERKVSDYPLSWEEMDMELDIISLSFERNSGEESIKYIKKKRKLAKKRLDYLLSRNPELKGIQLTKEQEQEINSIGQIKITKISERSHRDFDCSRTKLEILKLPRIYGGRYLTGAMYFLPECIIDFKSLKKISFPKHEIDKIPESLASISTLEVIELPENKLFELPQNIGDFTSLKYLNVSNNFISKIPESINQLQQIEYIDVSNNYLSEIPKKIYHLKSLKKLNLRGNQIPDKEIKKLKKKMKNCEVIH
ncbi:leucine-rich repeat domain-containing protein [Aquimarina sp. I32.4]|uniref:leucine-rich repeat domain-containing protein n=1 Tax=Aquimarina sp. I32.4 TaxID=2053903 RepID=UPI000CDE55FB|nr:leucine-rich repeat domain-containing protein [Aquimarina sp. I32.4]